ncbi:MAG: hypothetical protein ACRCZY_04975 [Phocaeicola sp.]
MRKLFYLCLCFASTSWAQLTYPSAESNANWTPSALEIESRDSIFKEAQEINPLSNRIVFLRNSFDEQLEYTKEYLDSARIWSIQSGDIEEQGKILLCYFDYYEARYEKKRVAEVFQNIKQLMKEYPEVDLSSAYFRLWISLAQKRVLEGHVEEGRFEAVEMLKEAEQLNSPDGRFYSYFLSSFANFQVRTPEGMNLSLEFLKKANELPNLSFMQQRWVCSRFYSYYARHKEYETARLYLRKELVVLEEEVKANPRFAKKSQSILLRNDMRMASLFTEENKLDSAKLYLEKADQHYLPGLYNPSYMNYKEEWVNYYLSKVKDVEGKDSDKVALYLNEALIHCNEALENGLYLHPIHSIDLKNKRSHLLKKMGRKRDAADSFRNTALCLDSLNRASVLNHTQAHETNYKINEYLKKQVERKQFFYFIAILASLVLLVFFIYVLVQMLYAEYSIQKYKSQIEKLYVETERANKLKNLFLKRIVNAIQTPLDNVVRCANKLSNSTDLTLTERTEYSFSIKRYATKLLNLVLNVLELSRLEAGMVKFNHEETDLLALMQEVKEAVEFSPNSKLLLENPSALSQLIVTIDSNYLKRVLLSILKPLYTLESTAISVAISVDKKVVDLTIYGSPLFAFEGEEIAVIHQLNETVLKSMGGSYSIIVANGSSAIHLAFNRQ